MDGTILRNESDDIHPETLEVIKQLKSEGHIIAIATGRPLSHLMRPMKKNDCLHDFDYLIGNNGSYFYDVKNDKVDYKNLVPMEVIEYMSEQAIEHDAFFAIHDSGDVRVVKVSENVTDLNLDGSKDTRTYYGMEETFAWIKKPTQVSTRTNAKDALKIAANVKAKFKNVDVTIANDLYVDVNAMGISKLTGLEDVLKVETGLTLEDVVSFGDSGNDVSMLEGSGYGVALGNATKEAKEAANETIGDNTTNAIAVKLREYIGG